MAEIVLAFIVGAVFGALIMVAWLVDGSFQPDPTEHGGNPL